MGLLLVLDTLIPPLYIVLLAWERYSLSVDETTNHHRLISTNQVSREVE